jgi:RNA polymerase sigma factor (sigma-70 family)
MAAAEGADRVWAAVRALPPLERAAVTLRYRDGLSYQDIAGRLDKTATHVGVLLHTAINRLREHGGLSCLVPGGTA